MIIIFSKYLVFLNIVTTFATNYEYKKQNIQYCPLRQFVGVHFICCIYPIHQPGGVLYGEVFYTAHDRSEFIYGAPFFHTLLSKPFGLMQYAGAWLTQLFCRPAFGSAVLAAIWVLIFLVGIKAFRLKPSASALMLLPVVALVGGTLHPAPMAPCLVSVRRLSLSGARVVRLTLRAMLSGCRKAHLA